MCFDSVTSLLQFVNTGVAFRFLHTVTRRIASSGAMAYYHVRPDVLDEQTVATIRILFDHVVTVTDESGGSV